MRITNCATEICLFLLKKNLKVPNFRISKCQNDTLDCTLEEISIIQAIKNNPKITQAKLAKNLKKSLRTVKRIMTNLQDKKIITRENGRRDGFWKIKE